MLTQCFTDNVESIRQGGIAEDLLGRTSALRPDGGHHRLLRIDELDLRPRKGGRQAANGAARLLHGHPPYSEAQV